MQVTNIGVISFDQDFYKTLPEAFPSETDISVYTAFLVAPYWSNIDTRLDGTVDYQVLNIAEGGAETTSRFTQVMNFINLEADTDFAGASWMLIATWKGVHPFPHGNSAEQDRQDPYLQSVSATIETKAKTIPLLHKETLLKKLRILFFKCTY